MWRATFIAIGVSLCILGLECLVVDRVILKSREEAVATTQSSTVFQSTTPVAERREYKPKEWMPWSMLSTGAVVILYSFTLPKRVQS